MSRLILWRKSNPVSWHSMIRGSKSNAIINFYGKRGESVHYLLALNKYNAWHMVTKGIGESICNAAGVEGG